LHRSLYIFIFSISLKEVKIKLDNFRELGLRRFLLEQRFRQAQVICIVGAALLLRLVTETVTLEKRLGS
jgi:hypothetical protein